jgi:hypothetical protein
MQMATSTKEIVLVTVENVQETGRNGFWEMEVAEYDEPLATKEQKIIDVIKSLAAGQQAQVEMGVKQNGDFTNRYLNSITPTGGAVEPKPGAPAPQAVGPTKRDERESTQARIQAQWAFGQALQVYVAGGGDLQGLHDTDTFAGVQTAADILRTAANALADK